MTITKVGQTYYVDGRPTTARRFARDRNLTLSEARFQLRKPLWEKRAVKRAANMRRGESYLVIGRLLRRPRLIHPRNYGHILYRAIQQKFNEFSPEPTPEPTVRASPEG